MASLETNISLYQESYVSELFVWTDGVIYPSGLYLYYQIYMKAHITRLCMTQQIIIIFIARVN